MTAQVLAGVRTFMHGGRAYEVSIAKASTNGYGTVVFDRPGMCVTGEPPLFGLERRLTDDEITIAIDAFLSGFVSGQKNGIEIGKIRMQADLRDILGLPAT